jgi:hypothetical protein
VPVKVSEILSQKQLGYDGSRLWSQPLRKWRRGIAAQSWLEKA